MPSFLPNSQSSTKDDGQVFNSFYIRASSSTPQPASWQNSGARPFPWFLRVVSEAWLPLILHQVGKFVSPRPVKSHRHAVLLPLLGHANGHLSRGCSQAGYRSKSSSCRLLSCLTPSTSSGRSRKKDRTRQRHIGSSSSLIAWAS